MTDQTDGQQPGAEAEAIAPVTAQVETNQADATNADDTDADVTGDDGADDTANADGERKPARGVQKRLDELTRQRHEAARDADYWRQQAQTLAERLAPAPQTAPTAEVAPTLEAFDYDEGAYQRAAMEWAQKQAERAVESAFERREREAQEKAASADFDSKVTEARAKYADFDAVVFSPSVAITQDMAETLRSLPDGADIAYQLGKNPSEAARIASLPPRAQAVEIGRMAGRSAPAPQPKPNPPAPPRTVGGANSGAVQKDFSQMSMAEFAKARGYA